MNARTAIACRPSCGSLRVALAVALAIALSACASGVTRAPDAALQIPQFDDPGEKAGALSISLSDEAKKDAAENQKFDPKELLATVRRTLKVDNLISPRPNPNLSAIEITVTSVRVRSNLSAIMFGFMAGNDHVDGDVVVRAPDGTEMQRFGVSASYALGGLAGGQDSARLDWIYQTFAERMTEELTGRTKVQ